MAKKKRIKIYSSNGKKLVMLSEQEIHDIKNDERYEKIYESAFAKGKHSFEVKHYYSGMFWKDFLLIVLASLITTVALDYFISITGAGGLFPGGIGAFARFFSIIGAERINVSTSTLYFVIYFLINIPLAFFGWKKIGGRFTTLTLIYMFLNIVFDIMLQNIPFINPNELALLIDYNLLNLIPNAWSVIIWLFVFALFGGMINAWGYAIVYKTSGSTGGSDFISYYYSKKHNKSIGMINVRINIAILVIVLLLNSLIISMDNVDSSIKLSVIYNHFDNYDELHNSLFWQNINEVFEKHGSLKIDGEEWKYWQEKLLSKNENFKENWLTISRFISSNNKFSLAYTDDMLILIRMKFVFGPSLFASLTLIIVQGITVDKLYPKNKIMNLFISTNKIEEVNQYLFNVGYTNNVFVWRTVSSKKNAWSEQEQDMIMVSMPMIYLKKIKKHIMNIDEDMILNIIESKSVKGKNFSYSFDTELRDKALTEEFINNARLMQKIENDAIINTYKKIKKS